MSDFQQTVDLKQKMEQAKKPKPLPVKKPAPAPAQPARERSKAEDIDRVFRPTREEMNSESSMGKMDLPKPNKSYESVYKSIILILVAVVIVVGAMYMKKNNAQPVLQTETEIEAKWYSIKLVTDEIFYGQIGDTAADPIKIANVYYNYDQIKSGEEAGSSSNLRLVKRGKETYGPEGSMDIVRSQVVYMEPLKQDSKVLKAILEYEK